MKGQVVAIIPARGNSKGIPGKNIKSFLGKPLITYTIEAVRKAKSIDRVIVSTEADPVAAVAEKHGVEVFRRSQNLAQDTTPINPVIEEVIEFLKRDRCPVETVVVLYPTAPLRTAVDIDRAVALARRIKTYDSVAGVCMADVAPYGGLNLRNGRLSYAFAGAKTIYRRQDAPTLYKLNGAIWVLNAARFARLNRSLLGSKSFPYIMERERSVDIDTEFDWKIAECLARQFWSQRAGPLPKSRTKERSRRSGRMRAAGTDRH